MADKLETVQMLFFFIAHVKTEQRSRWGDDKMLWVIKLFYDFVIFGLQPFK